LERKEHFAAGQVKHPGRKDIDTDAVEKDAILVVILRARAKDGDDYEIESAKDVRVRSTGQQEEAKNRDDCEKTDVLNGGW